MRLAVVSDTHAHFENTMAAVRMLSSLDVNVVIHCGDIGSAEIVPMFKSWPTHFVFGNVDYDESLLRKVIEQEGQTCHDRFGQLELAHKKIAFLHSDDALLFRQTIGDGAFDLVCYGHTHVAQQEMVGDTLVLNPGALYRAKPHSFALVDLPSLEVTFISI
jgi:putative phosphoesterase